LWNPREQPTDHLPSKLHPDWLGPYEVIKQVKNDITAKHLVLHSDAVLHVDRVKPFFGTREQAITIAKHDHHQFNIISFNYYTGNPFVRTSLSFNITFEDGTINMPYGGDFIHSEQFESYILAIPELFPLRFSAKLALKEVRKLEKLAITTISPSKHAFINLRIYDGQTSTWFDSLNLPYHNKTYITPIIFTKWYHRHNHSMIVAIVPIFDKTHDKHTLFLTSYDMMAYVLLDRPSGDSTVLLNFENQDKYPQLFD
jgi:hypothetical protein